MTFAQLLRRLADISGLKRIRFASPHPSDFTDELLEVMESCPQICDQIHLPVQSGSTKILKAMRRGYTRESTLALSKKSGNQNAPLHFNRLHCRIPGRNGRRLSRYFKHA